MRPVRTALIIGLALCVAHCASDEETTFGASNPGMRATVDGQEWEAGIHLPNVPAGLAMSVTGSRRRIGAGETLTFTGTQTDGSSGTGISIAFHSRTGFPLGTYEIRSSASGASSDNTADAQLTWDDDRTYDAVSGTLTLRSLDDQSAAGSFELSVRDGTRTIEITGGQFGSTYRTL